MVPLNKTKALACHACCLIAVACPTSPAGGWGKPPVDESGVPVYGDVFDTVGVEVDSDDDVPRSIHWGELEVADEESEAEDDEDDEDDEDGGLWEGSPGVVGCTFMSSSKTCGQLLAEPRP